jgi:hypothetical protein
MAIDWNELRIDTDGLGAVAFDVWAKPNARKSAVAGVRGGALEVRLAARPVDGSANHELIDLIATILGVPARNVRLVRGASSRAKRIEVHGLGVEEVRTGLIGESPR